MSRKIYVKFFILAVCAVLVGSVLSANAAPILIGIGEDVTGYNADAGRAERDVAIMCIDEWNAKGGINGQKIEYVYRDNAGDPTKALTVVKEFMNLGVVGVIGGTSTTVGLAEASVLVPAQIPHMVVSMSAKFWDIKGPDGKWYVFTFVGSEPVLTEGWIETAMKVPVHKKIAILHVNNFYGKSLRESMIRTIKEKYAAEKMEVVDYVEIDLKPSDASKEVTRMKALNPDVMLFVLFPDAAMAWFRACNDMKYHPATACSWMNVESVYLSSEPKFLYNVYGYSTYDLRRKEVAEKLDQFKKRFGYTPVAHWACGWDATNVLLTAIKNVGTDRIAIRDWIATKSKGMPVISGNKKAVCRFEDGSPYFYTVCHPKDYAQVYVDKDGKIEWKD